LWITWFKYTTFEPLPLWWNVYIIHCTFIRNLNLYKPRDIAIIRGIYIWAGSQILLPPKYGWTFFFLGTAWRWLYFTHGRTRARKTFHNRAIKRFHRSAGLIAVYEFIIRLGHPLLHPADTANHRHVVAPTLKISFRQNIGKVCVFFPCYFILFIYFFSSLL